VAPLRRPQTPIDHSGQFAVNNEPDSKVWIRIY